MKALFKKYHAKQMGQEGFTLVEFMIVVAVIITIAAIVLKFGGGAIDKKNTAAALRQFEQIVSGMQKYKADLGTFPAGTLNVLWDKTVVAAAAQPYWKGPYITVPEQVSGGNPADANMAGVVYSRVTFTAAGGGAGNCANVTKIGTGNATSAQVILATAMPQEVATQLKSAQGSKICVEDTAAVTTNVYQLVEETY